MIHQYPAASAASLSSLALLLLTGSYQHNMRMQTITMNNTNEKIPPHKIVFANGKPFATIESALSNPLFISRTVTLVGQTSPLVMKHIKWQAKTMLVIISVKMLRIVRVISMHQVFLLVTNKIPTMAVPKARIPFKIERPNIKKSSQ